MNHQRIISALIFMWCISLIANAQSNPISYRIIQRIALSGDGGWDYLSVDAQQQRLFVSHSNQVNVVDLKTNRPIAIIPNTPGVHGITFAYDLNKGFISNGKDSSVTVFNLTTLKTMEKIPVTGKNPDAILYDPFSQCVLTFNGGSSNATVIDAKNNRVITTISLPGKPEFAQTDGAGHIYNNIETKNSVIEINAKTWKIDHEWPIAPGEEPSGLAIDVKHHRLFSVCSNQKMMVLNLLNGKIITSLPIGKHCDGVVFDPLHQRVISSNGEGTITVVSEETPNQFKVSNTMATQAGARTIAVNDKTGRLYLSVAEFEPGEGRRPVKPNTFQVLVLEPVR
ncbi:MAG: YncE family protein [Microbacter sp.]